MQHLALGTIFWLIVTLATFNNGVATNAIDVDKNANIDKINMLLGEQGDRLSLDPGDQEADQFSPEEIFNDASAMVGGDPISSEEGIDESIEMNENESIDYETIQKQLRRNRITDILVGCFFFVAAVWLLLATCYSVILLILLRLQARGELDIYDENLGRVVLFNGKITLHFGFILRRYAVQLEEVSCCLGSEIVNFAYNCYGLYSLIFSLS